MSPSLFNRKYWNFPPVTHDFIFHPRPLCLARENKAERKVSVQNEDWGQFISSAEMWKADTGVSFDPLPRGVITARLASPCPSSAGTAEQRDHTVLLPGVPFLKAFLGRVFKETEITSCTPNSCMAFVKCSYLWCKEKEGDSNQRTMKR